MKVIQIRGTNATGKTTTIRGFINRGQFVIKTIKVGRRDIEYHWEDRRKIAIIGRYDKAVTGGVDGYITDKNELMDTILRIIKYIKPEILLFEGIVYGVTFKFAYELAHILKKYKYDYLGIVFMPPLDVVFQRLAIRNGGKEVDYMSVQGKWFSASSAYDKLLKSGINVKAVDTSKIPKEQMYRIIEDEI